MQIRHCLKNFTVFSTCHSTGARVQLLETGLGNSELELGVETPAGAGFTANWLCDSGHCTKYLFPWLSSSGS